MSKEKATPGEGHLDQATAPVEGGRAPVEATAPVEGSAAWYEEKVGIRLFKDTERYKDDVFVAVNGRGWLIRRGVEVQVPRYVAQVLEQSLDQDTATAELMERESAQFEAESQRRGLA